MPDTAQQPWTADRAFAEMMKRAQAYAANSGRGQSIVNQQAGFDSATLPIGAAGQAGASLAFPTLFNILASQGATDPLRLNRQFGQIDRGTETQQAGLQTQLAQAGLQNSGVGAALQAAIGQAGEGRRADALAEENRLQETRMREDLQLYQDLIQRPGIDLAALAAGQFQGQAQRDQQNDAATLAAIASIAAAFCWVARAVYGTEDPRWLDARFYILHIGPRWFRALYLKVGPRVGAFVAPRPWLRRILRPAFDYMVWRARLWQAVATFS